MLLVEKTKDFKKIFYIIILFSFIIHKIVV